MSGHLHLSRYQSTKGGKTETVNVTVMLGFDRPLQCFFMYVVEDTADPDEYLYRNLNDPEFYDSPCIDLDYFREKLSSFGIRVPESMFEQTELDAQWNVGNREVTHADDGWSGPKAAECVG